jgi:outer membrane receptor for monomeric catechols
MAGMSTSFTQNAGQYISERYTGPSLYIQDNFRVNSRLTINAGLRWDPLKPIRFNTPQVSLFDPAWYAAGVKSKVFTNGPTGILFSVMRYAREHNR